MRKIETNDFYKELTARFTELIRRHDLLDERIEVKGRILKPDEAIGTPQRKDFPLLKGKERLMEAGFKGARGQAFTAVSYTHLDVYKRQAIHRCKAADTQRDSVVQARGCLIRRW